MMYLTVPERPFRGPSTTSTASPTFTSLPAAEAEERWSDMLGCLTGERQVVKLAVCPGQGFLDSPASELSAGVDGKAMGGNQRQPSRSAFPSRPPVILTAVLDAGAPVVHLALDVGQAAHADVGLVGPALPG